MAFCNKLSGLVMSQEVPMATTLRSVRSLSTKLKLWVGGLWWGIDDRCLRDAFSCFGEVTHATVITDRDTGNSKGFGFVLFSDEESAKYAMSAMDGQEVNRRKLSVRYAKPRDPRFFFGGPRGGYDGDGAEGDHSY